MEDYIGIDVSMKETALSIRRGGQRVWRGKCVSDPKKIAQIVRKHAPSATRIVFETGPLSIWFYHALRAEGLPAICIDARHAKAALNMAADNTASMPRVKRSGTLASMGHPSPAQGAKYISGSTLTRWKSGLLKLLETI